VTDLTLALEVNYFRQAKDRYFMPISVKIPGSDIDVKLKGESAGQLSKHNLEYDTGFTLQPGSYTLKFLARENETGKMGTFETKFVVPDLTTEAAYLPISSVVPLIQDGSKLVPSVTRVFRKDEDMFVYLEAYQPGAEKTRLMVATVSFFRGGVKTFETAPLKVADGLNAKSKAVPMSFSVPLEKLAPGRYTCQVSVIDPGAQRMAVWRSPMVLLP
jgi:hypothetical protein